MTAASKETNKRAANLKPNRAVGYSVRYNKTTGHLETIWM